MTAQLARLGIPFEHKWQPVGYHDQTALAVRLLRAGDGDLTIGRHRGGWWCSARNGH